jgi:prepilin-type N-terminal cleavage/methylation domain-containing protein
VTSRHRHRAAGFTLLELTVALTVMAILMGAMTSAVLIASRAVPTSNDPVVATLAAGSEVDALADDLRYATAFAVLQPHVVQFSVPDRTGDGSPEEIRYEWSGTPGEALRQQMNGGAWADVVPSVQSLALNYNTKTVTTISEVPGTTTSPEMVFSYFNGWPGVSPTYSSVALTPTAWGAEFFTIDQVSFPPDAQNVRISRVQLMLQKVAASGSITVGIHAPAAAGSPQPGPNPLGTPATVPVSSLPVTFGWVDIAMPPDVIVPNSSTQLVIVVKGTVTNAACWRMFTSTSAPKDSSPTGLLTTDGGSSWQPNKSAQYKNDYPFYAYGTYQVDSTQEVTTTTYYLRSVGISLRVAGATGPLIGTAVEVYTQPRVTP